MDMVMDTMDAIVMEDMVVMADIDITAAMKKQLDEPVAEAGAVNQKEVFTETKEN